MQIIVEVLDFFFSSRRRHTRSLRDWSSDVCSSDLLGADVVNVSASGSSVEKGETLVDTVRTLRALGGDLLVVRHKDSGAAYTVAQHTDISVVNAGDGTHAHPTQALLDAYTIREHFGRLDGLRVLIVGDI